MTLASIQDFTFQARNSLLNHVNTVAPLLETFRNAKQPISHVNNTAAQGTPRFVVFLKNLGA
jgi:hypothetical protein